VRRDDDHLVQLGEKVEGEDPLDGVFDSAGCRVCDKNESAGNQQEPLNHEVLLPVRGRRGVSTRVAANYMAGRHGVHLSCAVTRVTLDFKGSDG
jgi:hypothetical protein